MSMELSVVIYMLLDDLYHRGLWPVVGCACAATQGLFGFDDLDKPLYICFKFRSI